MQFFHTICMTYFLIHIELGFRVSHWSALQVAYCDSHSHFRSNKWNRWCCRCCWYDRRPCAACAVVEIAIPNDLASSSVHIRTILRRTAVLSSIRAAAACMHPIYRTRPMWRAVEAMPNTDRVGKTVATGKVYKKLLISRSGENCRPNVSTNAPSSSSSSLLSSLAILCNFT